MACRSGGLSCRRLENGKEGSTDFEKCSRVLVAPVAREPGIWRSVAAMASRIYEEYGFDCVALVYTPRLSGEAGAQHLLEQTIDALKAVLRGTDVGIVNCPYSPYTSVSLDRSLRLLVECLCDTLGCNNVVLSPTPGSRRLAAAIGMAGIGAAGEASGNVDIVHVDFYWGPWRGLYYPFTPRFVQPLAILNPVHEEKRPRRLETPELYDPPPRKLPPLKKLVGELAWKTNRGTSYTARLEEERIAPCDVKLSLQVVADGQAIAEWVVEDACKPSAWLDWESSVERELESVIERLAARHRVDVYSVSRTIAAFSGLARLVIVERGGTAIDVVRPYPLMRAGSVVIDTNLVYLGVHNDVYEGLQAVLPHCLVAEVFRGYAEAEKRLEQHSVNRFLRLLARTGLEELREQGMPIIASPPPPCDTGITGIDLYQLQGAVIATNDRGAYEFWLQHPFSRLAEIAYAEPARIGKLYQYSGDDWLVAAASYALYQLSIVIKTFGEVLGTGGARIAVETSEGVTVVDPPTLPLAAKPRENKV